MDLIKNNFVFLREFIQEFESTGSICPTSKWAAKALVTPLNGDRAGNRILEAGPGTGSVTVHILKKMRPDDDLVICELNPRFMKVLKQNLQSNRDYIRNKDRITFFQGPVQDIPDSQKFDMIVCAIPFLNLDLQTVKEIFAKFRQMGHAGTVLTYYEYMWVREISKAMSPENRKRIKELERFFADMKTQHESSRKRVWLNVLPINVYRIDGVAA